MRRLVLGVIGHVDHGKTALVRALTGMETDRLPEERRRGISIALGFAHAPIGGAEIDFVDMPGHERFVRTMVSGATGIDAALLVVAATDGVMPQTREHVDIAALLGLRRAIIVVSKADLADPAPAGQAAAVLVAKAGLSAPEPIPVCAVTGAGVSALRAAIADLVQAPHAMEEAGDPYLAVDRAFSVAGHGTIVTGTLRHGPVRAGDEVEILPEGRAARIRGLQVHGRRVAEAQPGQRVAVNVRGIEASQVGRGMALAARGVLSSSNWLSVSLRAVEDAPALPNGALVHLLHGTAELPARVRLLDRETLAPGESGLAQLRCLMPVSVVARDRFVVRTVSPALTVAGGVVLDPDSVRLRRHDAPALARLGAFAAAGSRGVIEAELGQAGAAGVEMTRLARLAGIPAARVAAILQDTPVTMAGRRVAVLMPVFDGIVTAIPRALAGSDAISRERLLAALPGASMEVLDHALAQLAEAGIVRQGGGMVRLARPAQERDQARQEGELAARLAEMLRRAGLTPPDPCEVAADPRGRRALDRLIREGVIIRALDRVQKREVLFHRDTVEAAQRRLAPLLAGPGLRVSEAGAALGISRKFSVPLLEHLDAIRFTRRVADRRVLTRA